MVVRVTLITLFLVVQPSTVHASKKFLVDESKYHHSKMNSKAFQDDVMNAMGSMLGCGGQASAQRIASIRKTLTPMWRTLPKTHQSSDRIDRRSLRYLVHRYFMRTSSLMIRGFEPTRPVNASHWGAADILSQVVPAYVESVLESHHARKEGFDLEEAVTMVVMLDQLIFDSEGSLLQKVYDKQHKPMHRHLTHSGLKQVLEQYIVEWITEAGEEDMRILLQNNTLLTEVVPHYDQLMSFVEGRIKALQFANTRNTPKKHGKSTWEIKYSYEDAHAIVGGITRSFQSFWQSECENMKLSLVEMDIQNTGRVPLSKFYGAAIDTEWRFGESEAYLRELGALDESSSYAGPQVIIPNYIQASSNCIVSTSHYLVCCTNDCENLLGEIEDAVGAPTASPLVLLPVIGNMTAQTTIDHDEPPILENALIEQLEQIAKVHGDKVPLHGRLFAQWLHYVFPRECPFPHKMGTVGTAVTPTQYGDEYIASTADMRRHASNATAASLPVKVDKEELQWMSQWSSEEEFIVDYSSELGMSWQSRCLLLVASVVLFIFGVSGGVIGCSRKNPAPNTRFSWSTTRWV